MTSFKVLLYIDHAPNYRESFLNELGKYYSLTVVAHPCEIDGLKPPNTRSEYEYIELNRTFGKGIRFNFQLSKIINQIKPDVVCVALNLRYPIRILDFLINSKLKSRWIWWGQIYGRSENIYLHKLKELLINNAAGALVYTDDIVSKLKAKNVKSFDNSQFSQREHVELENVLDKVSLRCLFVGRPQKRKRLELLIELAKSRKDLSFRLVGPDMVEFFKDTLLPSNLELYPAASGEKLQEHFKWCNLVVNPGHVGLLVMNAACHNRPIVIDSKVEHAPEVILAKSADQYFIDFLNKNETNIFFDSIIKNPDDLINKGKQLYKYSIEKYTVEKMALNHTIMFDQIISKDFN